MGMPAQDIIIQMPADPGGWSDGVKWAMGIISTVLGGGLSWLLWRRREHK